MHNLPLHRLKHFLGLESRDAEAFAALLGEQRHFDRHDIIRRAGHTPPEIYFLIDGWVASRVESQQPRSQIVKVHLPGDIMGDSSLALDHSAETLLALNSVTLAAVPAGALAELFVRSPRFAASLFLIAQQERVWLMDRLTSVGRTSAVHRIGGLLLSLHDRLQAIDPSRPPSYELPLSQHEIGNVLGITQVHANRSIIRLEETGLIARNGRLVTIVDIPGLRKFSGVPQREFSGTPEWMRMLRSLSSSG